MSTLPRRPRLRLSRLLVAAAFAATGVVAGGATASSEFVERPDDDGMCFDLEYQYVKEVRGTLSWSFTKNGPWYEPIVSAPTFDWENWSGDTYRWESDGFSQQGPHSAVQARWWDGVWYRKYTTEYRYEKTGNTRDGDQIRCEQPDPVAPFVTEWVDGIWACDDTTVTQTRTIVTYEWVESGKYDWTLVSTANVETRVRDLTVDEQFPCEVPIDEEPETPIEEDPETPIEEEPETPIDEPADEVAPPVEDEEEALAPVTPTLPETPAPAPTPAAPVAAPTVLPSAGSSTGILAALAALLMLTGLGAHRFGRQRIN